MEIVAGPLDWTSDDEHNWEKWLQTETGKRLIPRLVESIPALLPAGDVNAILIRSGEMRGWQAAVSQLLSMTHHTQQSAGEVVENYPRLDDDTKWNDGQKIVFNTPDEVKK